MSVVMSHPLVQRPIDEAQVIPVRLRRPHDKQETFVYSKAKRIIVRAGRRGGKTVGIATKAALAFLNGQRVLYSAPTSDQLKRFWFEISRAFAEAVDAGVLYKNETDHIIEKRGTEQRIRAKTAWNAATLRGDYADLLIFDEWQLTNEDAWGDVGAPMLMDNNGDAVFIYTPPSLHTKEISKAKDPRHAAKMYVLAEAEMKAAAAEARPAKWLALWFTSRDNPHLSQEGMREVMRDMTQASIRREIEALDDQEVPGALWKRALLDRTRVSRVPEGVGLERVVIPVDPTGSSTNEAGIVPCARGTDGHLYVLSDDSMLAPSSDAWARKAVNRYFQLGADALIAETNYGGDMVENTIRTVRGPNDEKLGDRVSYENVTATRGKIIRAEPVASYFENGVAHLVGFFPELEDELCSYVPGQSKSPNRLDAMVWGGIALMEGRDVLGLIGYYRDGGAEATMAELQKIGRATSLAKPATNEATPACKRCGSHLLNPIAGGQIRCQQCGDQTWPEDKAPSLEHGPSRAAYLEKMFR